MVLFQKPDCSTVPKVNNKGKHSSSAETWSKIQTGSSYKSRFHDTETKATTHISDR